jgi:hypothetical protein
MVYKGDIINNLYEGLHERERGIEQHNPYIYLFIYLLFIFIFIFAFYMVARAKMSS